MPSPTNLPNPQLPPNPPPIPLATPTTLPSAVQIRLDRNVLQFPNSNFRNGGAEDDRVLMSVQNPGETNNANFATPLEYVLSQDIDTNI